MPTVKTTAQRNKVLEEIEDCLKELSSTKTPTPHQIQKKYPALWSVLQERDNDLGSKVTQETLWEIKKSLQALKELTVFVNPQTAAEELKDIAQILRVDALTDIKLEPQITAGITCSYQGVYQDFTLDKIIREKIVPTT